MSSATNPNPNISGLEGYDDSGHQIVKIRAKNVTQDTSVSPPITVGDLGVDVEVSISPSANQRVNTQAGDVAAGSFVAGALVDGADATQGTKADSAITNPASSGTLMAFIKGLLTNLAL